MELNLNDPFEFWVAQNFLDITQVELASKRQAWDEAYRLGVEQERGRCAVDTKRLDWMDTLQHRTLASGVPSKHWSIPTDCHACAGQWSIYKRTGIGSQIASEGHGKTIRDAIDEAIERGE